MGKKIEPSVAPLIPKDLGSGVKCISDSGVLIYGEGCIGAFQVKVGLLDLIALEFKTSKLAQKEATRLGQFYYKNWVFDDVADEPVLERFVIEAYGAKRAYAPGTKPQK